jgi:hypothetical protein
VNVFKDNTSYRDALTLPSHRLLGGPPARWIVGTAPGGDPMEFARFPQAVRWLATCTVPRHAAQAATLMLL